MVDANTLARPYQGYAIKFHKNDEVKGLSLLLHQTMEFGGLDDGIFIVYQKDMALLERARIRYRSCELRGQTVSEIKGELEI